MDESIDRSAMMDTNVCSPVVRRSRITADTNYTINHEKMSSVIIGIVGR
jgi:hypothetical protein